MPEQRWFANTARGAYHLEGYSWVQTGLARCGYPIRNPAMTARGNGREVSGLRLCTRCAKHARAEDLRTATYHQYAAQRLASQARESYRTGEPHALYYQRQAQAQYAAARKLLGID